jgi:hypothetical protein
MTTAPAPVARRRECPPSRTSPFRRDVIGFVQHLLASRHPYREKTVATHLRTFFQYLFWRGATAIKVILPVSHTDPAGNKSGSTES